MDKEPTPTKRTRRTGAIHKRVPQRPASVPGDIYIAHKSRTPVILKRIRQLLVNKKYKSVTLHAMGAMVTRAVSMALAAKQSLNDLVDLKTKTGTVALIDDVIPDDMDEDIETQERFNSAIHIKLIPRAGLVTLQSSAGSIANHPSRNRVRKR